MGFSQKKFCSFSMEKQRKEVFILAQQIEEKWQRGEENLPLQELCMLLGWMPDDRYHRCAQQLSGELTLHQFNQIMMRLRSDDMPDERDYDFVVYSRDADSPAARRHSVVLILDNLRSAFNVGSIIRTAECFGIEAVYLCGYTPTPENRQVKKTAMGSDAWVQWKQFSTTIQAVEDARAAGYRVCALETTSHAEELHKTKIPHPCALVLGNEALGIDPQVIARCDATLKIALFGRKNSLNVGVTAAIACYEVTRD
jgi:tRNA G18 (ribose-2'-O)-methylase SpoU